MKTRIKELRAVHGLTQVELAKRSGVRRETIVFLEKGKYKAVLLNRWEGEEEVVWEEEEEEMLKAARDNEVMVITIGKKGLRGGERVTLKLGNSILLEDPMKSSRMVELKKSQEVVISMRGGTREGRRKWWKAK